MKVLAVAQWFVQQCMPLDRLLTPEEIQILTKNALACARALLKEPVGGGL
jgi:hypothetical protein